MEMVVVLAILSLLATMAAPYAIKAIKRDKEIQLHETLRNVRTAIDRFHADVEGVPAEKGPRSAPAPTATHSPFRLWSTVSRKAPRMASPNENAICALCR
jgi:type II secretory pathway pseudopilin PulG